MARWYLEGSLDETGTVKKIPLTKFPFVIGRSKSIDLVVLRSGISREHAEICSVEGKLYIQDLKSTNGTYVDKERVVGDVSLAHNCVIHFAQYDFKLVDSEYKPPADEMMTVVMNVEGAIYRDDSSKSGGGAKLKESGNKKNLSNGGQSEERSPPKSIKPVGAKEVDNDSLNIESEGLEDVSHNQAGTSNDKAPKKSINLKFNAPENEKVYVQGSWDESNRRLHTRREARWSAQITLKNQQAIQCITKDISEAGFALTSSVSLPEYTLVKVDIHAFYKGRNREITVLGVVRHSLITAGGFIIGIQLKSCGKKTSDFITKFANREI